MASSDMLVWTPSRPSLTPMLHQSTSAASLRSASSGWWPADDVVPVSKEEYLALRVLRARERQLQRSRRRPPNEVKQLLDEAGKVQAASLVPRRRERKDFRETNRTSDIPGASSAKLAGHTSSGVAIDRRHGWPYAVAFDYDNDGLFEQPPALPPPRDARAERTLRRAVTSTGELLAQPPDPDRPRIQAARYTFAENVWRTGSVEMHLSTPGIGIKCARKQLAPLIKPSSLPRHPVINQSERSKWDLQNSNARAQPTDWAADHRRAQDALKAQSTRAPPSWPKPALDTPAQSAPLDRSMSTLDIAGAKPRRLVSQAARHSGVGDGRGKSPRGASRVPNSNRFYPCA